MKENKISVVIKKPVKEVFDYTTDPEKTPVWISWIKKEESSEYPPRLGTKYRNTDGNRWDEYEVVEFEQNKLFTLADPERNYHVKYVYNDLNGETELIYFEWVERGDLTKPFQQEVLNKLKEILE